MRADGSVEELLQELAAIGTRATQPAQYALELLADLHHAVVALRRRHFELELRLALSVHALRAATSASSAPVFWTFA